MTEQIRGDSGVGPISNPSPEVLKTPAGSKKEVSNVLKSDTLETAATMNTGLKNVASREKAAIEKAISTPHSPELPPPQKRDSIDTLSPPAYNPWLNGSALVSLGDATAAMYLMLQKQKWIEKEFDLKYQTQFYDAQKSSAKNTLEIAKKRMMEHIFRAGAQVVTGAGSVASAIMLPQSGNSKFAIGLAISKALESAGQVASEGVSATYAVPIATLEAQKQLLEALSQLIQGNRDSMASGSKEAQDDLNRLLQQIADIVQKYKDAVKMLQI